MTNRWDGDNDFEEHVLTSVVEDPKGWTISHGGWCFGVSREHGIVPHVGDVARFYPGGIGYMVRGLLLNGREVYYRTAAEQEAENARRLEADRAERKRKFETEGRAKLDADYVTLPREFKARLDGLRARNADFRVEHEPYEMFVCLEAVKIAAALRTGERVKAFGAAPFETQRTMVPDVSGDHSGNTLGAAIRLAYWFVTEPENVAREHGALCPLVGCRDYGCEQAANAGGGER